METPQEVGRDDYMVSGLGGSSKIASRASAYRVEARKRFKEKTTVKTRTLTLILIDAFTGARDSRTRGGFSFRCGRKINHTRGERRPKERTEERGFD